MRDTVMPAQVILIEKAPEISQSRGKRGEERGQHAPAEQAAIERGAIKSGQSKPGGVKSRSGAGVDHKKELVEGADQDGDSGERSGEQEERSAENRQARAQSDGRVRKEAGIQSKDDRGKKSPGGQHQNAIHQSGERAARDGRGWNGKQVRPGRRHWRRRLHEYSAQGRRRRKNFRDFDDARAIGIEDGVGEFAAVKDGDGRGTRKLDDLGGFLEWFVHWQRGGGVWFAGATDEGDVLRGR